MQRGGGNRYTGGVWAPAIRQHEGRFYVYFATPNEGVFMVSSTRPEGPWSAPVALIAQAGLEDPCPFWDDDGNAYLVHSKVGAGPLILHRMSPDGTRVLDEGKVIVEDKANLPVLEGPKVYKRNGWYYIFAPYGGVETGPQAVLRARSIWGPYQQRTVLEQGSSSVQAPHQGAWVQTALGEDWFIHFNSTGAYGRIVHLQPMQWVDDWPVIGQPIAGKVSGQPVAGHAVPRMGRVHAPVYLQDSDQFSTQKLGVQWEWNHNPDNGRWSLSERPGYLRLHATPSQYLLTARNTLTQIQQGERSQVTARLELAGLADGQKAGLSMFGARPSAIGVVRTGGVNRIVHASAGVETQGPIITAPSVQLRLDTGANESVRYAYSLDEGRSFVPLGEAARMRFSFWKGARPALYSYNTLGAQGYADIDWVHVDVQSPPKETVSGR